MYKVERKYRQTRQIFELKFIYFEFWHLWYVVFEDVQRSKLAQGGIGQHHYRLVSQLRRKRINPRVGKRLSKNLCEGHIRQRLLDPWPGNVLLPPWHPPGVQNQNIGKPKFVYKQDHQRWGYSTVERFEKIWTKIKEKNKEITIFWYGGIVKR